MVLGNSHLEIEVVIDDAISLFENRGSEIAMIEDINNLGQEIASIMEEKAKNTSKYLSNLRAEVEEAEAICTRPETEKNLHLERVNEYIKEKKRVSDNMMKMKHEIQQMDESSDKIQREKREIIRQAKGIHEESAKQFPRMKSAVNLYASLSHIRWDYEEDSTNFLKGERLPPTGDAIPFELSQLSPQDQFETANSLWEMIK